MGQLSIMSCSLTSDPHNISNASKRLKWSRLSMPQTLYRSKCQSFLKKRIPNLDLHYTHKIRSKNNELIVNTIKLKIKWKEPTKTINDSFRLHKLQILKLTFKNIRRKKTITEKKATTTVKIYTKAYNKQLVRRS